MTFLGRLRPDSTAFKARGTRQIPLLHRRIGRQDGARVGPRMAAVHDDREVDARAHAVERRAQPVVPERIVPVEIGRAQDLVAAVGLVAVVVGHVAIRGRNSAAAATSPFFESRTSALMPACMAFFVAAPSVQHGDVALLEAVELDERRAQVLHVVDTAPEVGAGYLIPVDSDQQRSLCHHTPP